MRAEIANDLAEQGGHHLVMVLYDPSHSPHYEWVYNRADIDGSDVVWARSLGPAPDRALLRYFGERTAWVVRADASRPVLEHHPLRASPQ